MSADRVALSPKERLALSRKALVVQLYGDEPQEQVIDIEATEPRRIASRPRRGIIDQFPWAAMARNVAQRWWNRHPANAAGQLARPLLERYARQQPTKLMAAAAAVGALAVLVKPWRLLSITAVLAAVLKTSDVADMVTTLMNKNPSPRKDPP